MFFVFLPVKTSTMISKIKQILRPYIINYIGKKIPIQWTQQNHDSWLCQTISSSFINPPICPDRILIEKSAIATNAQGAQPLWDGYEESKKGNAKRLPNNVRTQPYMGNVFTYLVQLKKPEIIVEFGTAFGISGMYFLSGIQKNKTGQLFSFEPNEVWAQLAKENLKKISTRFILTIGTFEDNIDHVLPNDSTIDMAFIDAIHTSAFVLPQMEIVLKKSKSGTIILFDDINFSEDMLSCWKRIAADTRFIATATIGERVGIAEVK
jgi:predicted O-methyltransferase YrrM